MRHLLRILLIALVATGLAGCDLLGIETTSQIAARKEAEGKAIGSACRHAVRSIEDCFESNPRAGKAAVFAGWKEMDQYMRENKLEGAPSVLTQLEQKPAAAPARSPEGDEEDPPRSSRKRG